VKQSRRDLDDHVHAFRAGAEPGQAAEFVVQFDDAAPVAQQFRDCKECAFGVMAVGRAVGEDWRAGKWGLMN
jgi:hypothetical protein